MAQILSSITAYVAAAPATRIRFGRARCARHQADIPGRNAERLGDQLSQRRVGFALARRRAHTHLQHTASIRQLFDAVDRVTPPRGVSRTASTSPSASTRQGGAAALTQLNAETKSQMMS